MKRSSIGEFEEIVMLTTAVLYDNAYGVAIKNEIERRMDRKVSVGAMRAALERLEKKGFLESSLGEATKVRGGKRKRFFRVTPQGKQVLDTVREARQQLWQDIPSIAFDFNRL